MEYNGGFVSSFPHSFGRWNTSNWRPEGGALGAGMWHLVRSGAAQKGVIFWGLVEQKRMPPLHPSSCLSQMLRLTVAPVEPFLRPWQAARPLWAQSPSGIFSLLLAFWVCVSFNNLSSLSGSPLLIFSKSSTETHHRYHLLWKYSWTTLA